MNKLSVSMLLKEFNDSDCNNIYSITAICFCDHKILLLKEKIYCSSILVSFVVVLLQIGVRLWGSHF